MLNSPTMSTSSRQKGILSCQKINLKKKPTSVGLCLHSLHLRHSYVSNTNDQAHTSHKHVSISFLPSESPTVCPGMFSSHRLWESVISRNNKDIWRNVRRRKETRGLSAPNGRLDARKMSGMQRKHRIPPEEGNKRPHFTYKHKGSRIFLNRNHFRSF